MSKLLVLLMDKDYPFTSQPHSPIPNQNILVRQTLSTPKNYRNSILAKANFLKNLKNKYLVKVESLYQEDETLHIMYEYVQSKLTNVLQTATTLLINKIYAQLNQFGRYLSNIGVRILFNIDRIGFTAKQQLKYFMGLDFQWEQDPDEEYLQQFYYKQVQEILGPYMNQNIYKQVPPSISGMSIQKVEKIKNRKVSHSTIPQRQNRFNKIDEKLKQIRSSPKIVVEHIDRNKSSSRTVLKGNYHEKKYQQQLVNTKKTQSRKYSGDTHHDLRFRKKLIQKQSDIKSEYNSHTKTDVLTIKLEEPVKSTSDTGTAKTKSKIEEMKQKEYKEITNIKKQYLKDFLSVLQEDEQPNQISNPQQDSPILAIKKTVSQTQQVEMSTNQLQQMAKQAIQHSIKVMHIFRSLVQQH